ncbi:MAG: DEAD/DEAH box helicase [Gammaproteobacteria bacterium]|nr:DEAD/DEAH box helicase [Gammaproteobacteria bacterium]MYB12891.1 DEAD/DEAH box helicase [Rhodospirillaceae bacterium]MYI24568.1 DEAD/DEAH box helicase [Gammaproteobacteria bacterium]
MAGTGSDSVEPSAARSRNQNRPSADFARGDVVRFRTNPARTGVVTEVHSGETEPRYEVFHDGKVASYYQRQLLPVETSGELVSVLSLPSFHARLTALQLLHPSVSHLYSLHAARIEVIPYQFRPVLKLIQSDRPRLLIADSVGVGKTIEAGLILRELQSRREIRRVLIVCPRPLVTEEKWRQEMKRFDERFEHLDGPTLRFCLSETDLDGVWPQRYEKVIVPFSLFTEDLLHGKRGQKGLLALDPPPQFDLVIVDEAHHIRNTDTQRYQAVRFLCDNAEAVVFLTATPIQLHEQDLFVLLNTLRPDLIIDEAGYAAITEPNGPINQATLAARTGEPGWSERARSALKEAAQSAWGCSVLQKDPSFQEVLDSLADAESTRSGRVQAIQDIERLHTLSGLMSRTLRRDIGEFTQRKPETVTVEFTPEQKRLHDAVIASQAAVYSALHGDRSVNFLLTTIRRQASSCIHGLAPLLRDILSRRLSELNLNELGDGTDAAIDADQAISRIRTLVSEALALAEALPNDPASDPKFLALMKILNQKQSLQNNKAMLFSSFRHTLAYLEAALRQSGCRVGVIHGEVDDATRVARRARFEKDREDPDALDTLLFSEVGCEGLDYQFCDCMVNYDIPWNPMRIDQRIGRIDRWGQTSEAVAIYNLITADTIDADIYERCLLRIGVFEHALGANEAILGSITRELTSVAKNLALSSAERQAKLDQLADNSIRLVREQQNLEVRQTELFGLQVPGDQFRRDVEDAASYWLSATSLERLVSIYLRDYVSGTDAPLLGDGPKKLLRLSRAARTSILKDFSDIGRQSTTIAREWETWLKGSDPNLAVTFDSAYSVQDRAATLITPVHPLAIQAARRIESTASKAPIVGIQVTTNTVPAADYPFAIYHWQYHGIRNDVEFQPVTTDRTLTADFFELLPNAAELDINPSDVTRDMRTLLERQHYRLWSDARVRHADQTRRNADFRQGSLETSHAARMAIIESQLARADNERIRVMRAAQKANAQADFDRRSAEIEHAREKADIAAQPVGYGILRVAG